MLATLPPLTCVPSRVDPRDWTFEPADQALAAPPAAVDLREAPGAFPPPWDQGGLNSCTAQAMAAALHFDARRQDPATDFVPSRLFIYYNERRDEGTLGADRVHGRPVQMRDCIGAVAAAGACSEAAWPYQAANLDAAPPAAAYAEARLHCAASYHRLQQDLAHLKACLAQGFPFVFGLRVYASFPAYGSVGMASVPLPAPGERLLGGHALLAVGYDDARGVFVVRNSWGGEWGDGGCCYLPYGYLADPALAFDHWVVNTLAAAQPETAATAAPAVAADPAPAAAPAAQPDAVPAVAIYPSSANAEGTGAQVVTLSETWPTPWSNSYGQVQAQAIAAGDRLVGVAGGYLYAVDIYSGVEVLPVAQPAYPYPYQSALDYPPRIAAAGGLVYLADLVSYADPRLQLVALRVCDGTPAPRWQTPAQAFTRVQALLTPPGEVVVVDLDPAGATTVSGFDGVTGAASFGPVTVSAGSCGPVAYGAGAAFFVAGGTLQGVNVDFGDVRWKAGFAPAGAGALDPGAAPQVGRQVVVAATLGAPGQPSQVCGVDLLTGLQSWSVLPATANQQVQWLCAVDETGTQGVAASSAGEVVGFALADGTVAWRTTVAAAPGAPVVAEGVVSLVTDGRTVLTRLELATGKVVALYALPGLASGAAPVVTNATVFIPGADGIAAHAFGEQPAAYFDGATAYVDIPPDGTQFDFGTADFTVEAWVRSSEGGEVVSSYPTVSALAGQPVNCGFRLNLTADGQLRVAVVDPAGITANKGMTGPTGAADGEWHHLALLRRSGSFVVLVDGTAYPVFLPSVLAGTSSVASASAPLSLGGTAHLAVGAYVPGGGAPAQDFFQGLIREVRIWSRALDVATIQTNATVELTGCEPRLQGLWALDDGRESTGSTQTLVNEVAAHRTPATFFAPAFFPTDLEMDDSAFPYLLHEAQEQWPYAGTWAARGEHPALAGAAAAVCGGTVAFNAGNAVHGLREADGTKLWTIEVGAGASAPVAGSGVFYLLTGEDSVVAVDPVSGSWQQLPALAGLVQGDDGPFAAPAVSAGYLAAGAPVPGSASGSPSGKVMVMDLAAGTAVSTALAAPPQALSLGVFGVAVLSGSGSSWTISVVDPATGSITAPLAADSGSFCAAGKWIACTRQGAVVRLDPAGGTGPLATSTAPITAGGAAVTGMAAAPDADLLVVTASSGTVYGLSLATLAQRWAATPPGTGAARFPTFDAAGRVFCTTDGGAVAVLDPTGGSLLGYHPGGNAPVTPPVLDAAAAYFSCADPASSTAPTDGALHSVIFGETVALRLNLDAHGAPVAGTAACALVDAETAGCTLPLMDVTQSCVEAWINLPPATAGAARSPGGGLLGILPAVENPAGDGWGLSLSVGADGTLSYTALTGQAGVWNQTLAHTPAAVCDGRWHHVAVSRGNPASPLVFYLDGLPLPAVTPTTTKISTPATVTGLKAFIGATTADAAGNATDPFCGMIGEVRVWNTYLVSTQVATRMHVKLTGNEDGLLAYWNFDRVAVHDAALQGHDGAVVGAATDPLWWLTDLPFVHPAYPWLETVAARITADADTGAADTEYQLVLRAHGADGSGLAGQQLDLYYVIQSASDPAAVTINGTSVQGIMLGEESTHPGTPLSVLTLGDGSVSVSLATTVADHGPALDVHAAFMPANERFHVSTLIDNQKLAKPAPPTLTAQAKLIQDYHYTAGNQVDDSRDRSTWRVVLRAANSDQTVRPGEPVTLWTSDPATLECGAQSYPVTAENPVTLNADARGELAVVLDAADLTPTTLYARAGFMHRDDQVVVKPGQDAQSTLGAVQGTDLTTSKLTNWKPNATSTDQQTLLSGDAAGHADDVAGAVRNVMSATSSGGGSSQNGGPVGLGLGDGSAPGFAAMRQPVPSAADDRVALLRTVRRAPRRMPANPDAFHLALGEGHVGLVFDTSAVDPATGRRTLRCQLLATADDVARERGSLPAVAAAPIPLGGLLGDLWDDVKDTAVDVYDAATKLVISIDNQITAAITTLVNDVATIVDAVVASVEDAVAAVVGFFKQLAIDIGNVIQMLREMFDWGAILATHGIIKDVIHGCAALAASQLADGTSITNAITGPRPDTSQSAAPAAGSVNDLAGGPQASPPGLSGADSVKGKAMLQKSQDSPPTSTTGSAPAAPTDSGSTPLDELESGLAAILAMAPALLTTAPADLVANGGVLTQLEAKLRADLATGAAAAAKELGDAAVGLVAAVDTEIDIPFISALYYWITEEKYHLTILDLIALVLAIPVNVVYVAITGNEFHVDNAHLADHLTDYVSAPPPPAVGLADTSADAGTLLGLSPAADSRGLEVIYVVSLSFFTIANAITDYLFYAIKTAVAGGGALAKGRNLAKIVKGITGLAVACIQGFWISQRVRERAVSALPAGAQPAYLSCFEPVNWITFGCGAGASLVALGGGCAGLLSTPGASPSDWDKREFYCLLVAAFGTFVLFCYHVTQFSDNSGLDEYNIDRGSGVGREILMMRARDICLGFPRWFGWLYTKTGSGRADPDAIAAIGVLRAAANVIGVVLHSVAVFDSDETFTAWP